METLGVLFFNGSHNICHIFPRTCATVCVCVCLCVKLTPLLPRTSSLFFKLPALSPLYLCSFSSFFLCFFFLVWRTLRHHWGVNRERKRIEWEYNRQTKIKLFAFFAIILKWFSFFLAPNVNKKKKNQLEVFRTQWHTRRRVWGASFKLQTTRMCFFSDLRIY